MSTEMSSAVTSPAADEALRVAIAKLFSVFSRKYGHRWQRQFEDPKARPTWFASFRTAGVTAEMVDHGLAMLSKVGTGWPPSDEEFIRLSRPVEPTLEAALAEAGRWARDQSHEFSHPAIGAAAKSIGMWDLRSLDLKALRACFGTALRTALDRCARGENLDVPIPRALPAKVRVTLRPGEPEPASITAERLKCAKILGLSP